MIQSQEKQSKKKSLLEIEPDNGVNDTGKVNGKYY